MNAWMVNIRPFTTNTSCRSGDEEGARTLDVSGVTVPGRMVAPSARVAQRGRYSSSNDRLTPAQSVPLGRPDLDDHRRGDGPAAEAPERAVVPGGPVVHDHGRGPGP